MSTWHDSHDEDTRVLDSLTTRRGHARSQFAVVLALASHASTASAQRTRANACHVRHYAAYAGAQRDYQKTVAQLVVAADPTLRSLAELARAEQVARIDARQRAVESLLAITPANVRIVRPVNQWLDWGPSDAELLSRADTVFARLDSTAREARRRIAGHADWPRVQQVMRDRVQSEPAHRAALDRLTAAMKAPLRCG